MKYRLRISVAAQADLERMLDFLAEQDFETALRARAAIEKAYGLLREFPFSCRKPDEEKPFLRELLIGFGNSGYVALFEIEGEASVTVLAVRHQREDDYH